MALNKDLQAYKETKEFQDILKRAKNKVETLEAKILSVYNSDEIEFSNSSVEDLKHNMTHNEFDTKYAYDKFVNEVSELITHKKSKELQDFYKNRKENSTNFMFQAINRSGMSNSILRYTELDMLRFERAYWYGIEDDIDALIGTEDPVHEEIGAF